MKKELYFDISSEEKGGSLFRIYPEDAEPTFYHSYSTYDAERDDIQLFEKMYDSFESYWEDLTQDPEWHYLHPFFVHPEQRAFIKEQLQHVNWEINPDIKWQESHKNQWKKVLSDPERYYRAES